MNEQLKLKNIRNVLIRQEETIIFALIERAQFKLNKISNTQLGITIPGFKGSFSDYLLYSTECVHAKVRRYLSPDEQPFFKNLPSPIITSDLAESPIKENNININSLIKDAYVSKILPYICESGDDAQYGSSAVTDTIALQSISKRVHYGKFVAESKYLSNERKYRALIIEKNEDAIMELLTKKDVEEKLLNRVYIKACRYGQDPEDPNAKHKVNPSFIRDVYEKWLIPLTKDVELQYLLQR